MPARIIISACRPWDSTDSKTAIEPSEAQTVIDYCLHNCPYADSDCINCLGGRAEHWPPQGKGRPRKASTGEIRTLIMLETSPADICASLSISRQTLRNYIRKMKKEEQNA